MENLEISGTLAGASKMLVGAVLTIVGISLIYRLTKLLRGNFRRMWIVIFCLGLSLAGSAQDRIYYVDKGLTEHLGMSTGLGYTVDYVTMDMNFPAMTATITFYRPNGAPAARYSGQAHPPILYNNDTVIKEMWSDRFHGITIEVYEYIGDQAHRGAIILKGPHFLTILPLR